MLSLSDLINPRTKEAIFLQQIQALQGIGFVRHSGTGTGTVFASGVAIITVPVTVQITTSGEPGTASFKYSTLPNLATWSQEQTIPAGAFALPNSGCVIKFEPGPAGAGASFVKGDQYSFSLAIPTFPVTSWHPGSVPRTLLEIDAEVFEDIDALMAAIARGGFLDYAIGAWLDLLAWNVYGLTRGAAVATRGYITLTDTANAGPFNISIGQLWASTSNGLRFNNVRSGIIPQGGSISLLFQAECPGGQYNSGPGAVSNLLTPLPGVTCINAPDWLSLTPDCAQGADAESDQALRARCKGRWTALGIGATAITYDYWARTITAEPGPGEERVTKTYVRTSPTIPGQVEVYLAGDSGATNALTVAKVAAYIAERTPLTSTALVQAAGEIRVPITGTVNVIKSKRAIAEASANAALVSLFQSIPIGGVQLVGGKGLSRELIIDAISGQDGVLDANITDPASDIILTDTQIPAIGPINITWNEI